MFYISQKHIMEEEDRDFTEEEDIEERRPHKGGIILRFDPTNTR